MNISLIQLQEYYRDGFIDKALFDEAIKRRLTLLKDELQQIEKETEYYVSEQWHE